MISLTIIGFVIPLHALQQAEVLVLCLCCAKVRTAEYYTCCALQKRTVCTATYSTILRCTTVYVLYRTVCTTACVCATLYYTAFCVYCAALDLRVAAPMPPQALQTVTNTIFCTTTGDSHHQHSHKLWKFLQWRRERFQQCQYRQRHSGVEFPSGLRYNRNMKVSTENQVGVILMLRLLRCTVLY
eukprot:Lankesteria_metandrocarpae@DN7791_c0_g1_i1.p1